MRTPISGLHYVARSGSAEWTEDLQSGETVFFSFSGRARAIRFARLLTEKTGGSPWVPVRLTAQVLGYNQSNEPLVVAYNADSPEKPPYDAAPVDSVLKGMADGGTVDWQKHPAE